MMKKFVQKTLALALLATFAAVPMLGNKTAEAGKFGDLFRQRVNRNRDNDDPNGTKAFNRTHGRANEDGSDGMAWREKQDQNQDDPNGMNAFNRTHGRGDNQNHDGMAGREQQDDPNGMNAFNRTHGR